MRFRKSTSSVLRHRLTLQEEVETPDGAGGYARSWQDVADLWGQVLPASGRTSLGRERLFAGQLQASISHIVVLRYRGDVTAKHRLTFDSRVFNIRAVADPDGRKETLELLVEEGAAA